MKEWQGDRGPGVTQRTSPFSRRARGAGGTAASALMICGGLMFVACGGEDGGSASQTGASAESEPSAQSAKVAPAANSSVGSDAGVRSGAPAQTGPTTNPGATFKPSGAQPSLPKVHTPTVAHAHDLATKPATASSAGMATKVGGSAITVTNNIVQASLNIVQPGDTGDPSYTWYENIDDDDTDELCSCVEDDETGDHYVYCSGFDSACDDGARFTGDLLIEVAADQSFSVVIVGSNICDSGEDTLVCDYDTAGVEIGVGVWMGAGAKPGASSTALTASTTTTAVSSAPVKPPPAGASPVGAVGSKKPKVPSGERARDLAKRPDNAVSAGATTTVVNTSTSVTTTTNIIQLGINIVQADDPGDPSYTWFANVDDDGEDERCSEVDDDETGYKYFLYDGYASACDDGAAFEGALLIEVAPDASLSVTIVGSDLCDSGGGAFSCYYDALGSELSCDVGLHQPL